MILLALTMTLTFSCSYTVKEEKTLTVSILPQKYLLDRIVGERMKVRSLLNSAGDPETYDPSMSHLMNVEKSLAYFRVGHIGFEDAIGERIRKSCPGLPVIDTSEGIALIRGTHGHDSEVDPHIWTSVANARIMARNMHRAVVSLDPGHAREYDGNLERLLCHLDSVDAAIRGLLEHAPSRTFAVWHPSLSYFARDYGLTQLALGSEHKDASVASLKERIDSVEASDARVFFIQRDVDSRQSRAVLSQLRIGEAPVNPLDYDWDEEMLEIGRNLASPPVAEP